MADEYDFTQLTCEVIIDACIREQRDPNALVKPKTHPTEIIVALCDSYRQDPKPYIEKYSVDRRVDSVLVKLNKRQ